MKINLALAELPNFTADPSSGMAEHLTGSIEMAPTMEYIEAAFQDARVGKPALLPFSDGVIPTTLDKTLNPDGTHIMSLFTQWVPADWADAPHTEELDAYADRVIDTYDQVAPGFKSSITHRDIVGPHEMEQEYGLIGGNIFHGELSLEQLFHMRPAPGYADYRTPIAGLYNGSSGTHAGGGVCGIPGWQAARAALADKKRGRDAVPPRSRWTRTRRRAAVAAMLGARSMAVVGASARPDSFGARMVIEAQRGSARVHLVNPRYDRIGELPCAAVDRRPRRARRRGAARRPRRRADRPVGAAAADAGARVGRAVRVRARAARGDRGDRRRRRNGGVRRGLHGLRQQRARRAGAGLSRAGSVAATAAISLVTHSGSAFSTLLRARRGFGFRLAVSSGQELVTDTADYVDYALDDPETRGSSRCCWRRRARFPGCGGRCCAPPSRTCRS